MNNQKAHVETFNAFGKLHQGTNIFQYLNCPAGQVSYKFYTSCKHMYLSFKSINNKEHKGVICNLTYKVPYITVKMIFTLSNS